MDYVNYCFCRHSFKGQSAKYSEKIAIMAQQHPHTRLFVEKGSVFTKKFNFVMGY